MKNPLHQINKCLIGIFRHSQIVEILSYLGLDINCLYASVRMSEYNHVAFNIALQMKLSCLTGY